MEDKLSLFFLFIYFRVHLKLNFFLTQNIKGNQHDTQS